MLKGSKINPFLVKRNNQIKKWLADREAANKKEIKKGMKLYKALKLKNKLASEINQLQHNIRTENVVDENVSRNYDPIELTKQMESKTSDLI